MLVPPYYKMFFLHQTSNLLQTTIQPFKKYSLPEDAILGFCNPMVFVGEVKKFAGYAL